MNEFPRMYVDSTGNIVAYEIEWTQNWGQHFQILMLRACRNHNILHLRQFSYASDGNF